LDSTFPLDFFLASKDPVSLIRLPCFPPALGFFFLTCGTDRAFHLSDFRFSPCNFWLKLPFLVSILGRPKNRLPERPLFFIFVSGDVNFWDFHPEFFELVPFRKLAFPACSRGFFFSPLGRFLYCSIFLCPFSIVVSLFSLGGREVLDKPLFLAPGGFQVFPWCQPPHTC